MLNRSLSHFYPLAVLALVAPLGACAAGTKGDSTNTFGSSSASSSGSSVSGSGGSSGSLGGGGSAGDLGGTSGSTSDGAARPQRCDATGHCTCFNVASLGYGGHTGSQLGAMGTDNTQAFVSYLNTQSSAAVAQLGCGIDIGCASPNKPDLSDPTFLPNYDVLIFQWLAGSLAPVTNPNTGALEGYQGSNYWVFTQAELDALKAWVNGGGGVIVLSGYDFNAGEIGPTNQIVQALTGMQYTATDTFGLTQTGNAAFCLGDSNPVTTWAQTMPNGMPDPLGGLITEVGAFHGRAITTGPNSIVDCESNTFGVCAAHEDIGKGHVYIYTDEWVTYTSQWNPNPQPASYCSVTGSTANGDFPAVQFQYQTPQFWFNAISYAAQATMCPFTLTGVSPPPR